MARVYDRLRNLVERLTWVLTGALVVLVSANVFARYVLGIGILWAEELSRLCFVWAVFLGAYVALTRKGHMAILMAVRKVSPAWQSRVLAASRTLILVFLACLTYAGVDLVMATLRFGRITPMMEISSAWGYVAVPVAGALMAVEMLRQLLSAEPLPRDGPEPAATDDAEPA